MAEPKAPEDSKSIPPSNGGTTGLVQDEVIARLVPEPAAQPDVIALVGFLGKSHRPRFWRLYQTLDLKGYTEIAEDDIVHSESLATKLQPLGGTVIWVKSGARLQHTRSESRLAESEFLQGDITGNFLAGTGMEGLSERRAGSAVLPPPPPTKFCATKDSLVGFLRGNPVYAKCGGFSPSGEGLS